MTPWTIARQFPLSLGFSRQEYWSRLPFPSPGELPDPGIKPASLALWRILYHWATGEAPCIGLHTCISIPRAPFSPRGDLCPLLFNLGSIHVESMVGEMLWGLVVYFGASFMFSVCPPAESLKQHLPCEGVPHQRPPLGMFPQFTRKSLLLSSTDFLEKSEHLEQQFDSIPVRTFLYMKWKSLSRVQLFATSWTIQSMEFSRQEYWSG